MSERAVTWKLEKSPLGWKVDPLNAEVTQLQVDYAFSMTIDQEIQVRLETEFEYFDGDVVHTIDPENTISQSSLLAVFNADVAHIRLDETTDQLTIGFADGRWIRTHPHPQFESYSLHVPRSDTYFGGLFHGVPS